MQTKKNTSNKRNQPDITRSDRQFFICLYTVKDSSRKPFDRSKDFTGIVPSDQAVEKAYRDMRKKATLKPAYATSQYIKSSFALPVGKPIEGSFPPETTHPKNLTNFLLALCTFFLINVIWVFFRSPDFTSAWRLLHSMFSRNSSGTALLSWLDIFKVGLIMVALVIAHWLMRNTLVLKVAGKMPWWLLGVVWAAMLLLICLSQNASSSFIYFQF